MPSRLNRKQLDKLTKVAEQAAERAGRAIRGLFDKPVTVNVRDIHTLSIEQVADVLGEPEKPVSTTFLKIQGDLVGYMVLVLPEESMKAVLMHLIGRSEPVDDMARSALKEAGSIIAGSFLSEIADRLDIHVLSSIPALSIDMLRATLDPVSSAIAEWAEWAVILEIEFTVDESIGHFLVMIEPAEAGKILGNL